MGLEIEGASYMRPMARGEMALKVPKHIAWGDRREPQDQVRQKAKP
jgi:hypothetical protein